MADCRDSVGGSPTAPYGTGLIVGYQSGIEVQVPGLVCLIDQFGVYSQFDQPLCRERPPGLVAVHMDADLTVPEAGCFPAKRDCGQFFPAFVELFLVAIDGLLVPDRLFEQVIYLADGGLIGDRVLDFRQASRWLFRFRGYWFGRGHISSFSNPVPLQPTQTTGS